MAQGIIPSRVKELRKNKGLTQSELANKVGVSSQIISNLETGKITSVRDRTLKRLCFELCTVEDYLFGLSDERITHSNGLKQAIHISPDRINEDDLANAIKKYPEAIQLICECSKVLDSNTVDIISDILKAFIINKK